MPSTDRKLELQANDNGLNRLADDCVLKRMARPVASETTVCSNGLNTVQGIVDESWKQSVKYVWLSVFLSYLYIC